MHFSGSNYINLKRIDNLLIGVVLLARYRHMETKKKSKLLNPYILVILSFALVILVGSLLLTMPWANNFNAWLFNYKVNAETGQRITYLDCLFTAVSATCVTGLFSYPFPVAEVLSFPGQIVLVTMIEIGGLGFITILTFIITLFNSKLEFRDRYFISQMVGSTNFADVVKFVRKLIIISVIIVATGTVLGLPVFLTMYKDNILQGIWTSFFHSVSAFNNAGFDLFSNSLVGGVIGLNGETISSPLYVYLCIYTMLLIVVGGISFVVIIEVFTGHKKPTQWRPFTKIVLFTTAILLTVGTVGFFLFEGLTGDNRITFLDAIFQSVTCRTAGFSTFDQSNLSAGGKALSCLLMFIGGSPISTAGGIKTTTAFMVILAMVSYFSGSRPIAFKRLYSNNMVAKAMSLIFIVIFIVLLGYIGLNTFGLDPTTSHLYYEGLEAAGKSPQLSMDFGFELFSAMGTVGLGIGVEPYLSIGSKIVLCLIMFLGRIGPITFLSIFQYSMTKENQLHYDYVEEDFLIG